MPRQFDTWNEDDPMAWDHDTGAPGLHLFAGAVQVWSVMQDRPTSVAEAAMTFNVEPCRIVEAVEDGHYWMYLSGPRDDFARLMIEHEGE